MITARRFLTRWLFSTNHKNIVEEVPVIQPDPVHA